MASQLNTDTLARLPLTKNTTAEKLLVAASELMIERSAIEISLSDIAQKSGVNAALVKYHFGNKDGLLLALLARDAATEMAQLDYLWAQPITPTAKLKLHIAGIIRAYHQFPYMNRLIHYLLHESSGTRGRRGLEILCRASPGLSSPAAGGRHQGRRVPQCRSGAVLHQPDRRLRPSVFRTARDVARHRRRAGDRRSLPSIHPAHGSADLRRHADDQYGESGHAFRVTVALLRDDKNTKTKETPKERFYRCS